ncbi:Nucleotide-binding protein UspA family [Methanonatronarchaeum thermophilum]|uniref:Nucleotide-binding protein UspA family n=1 Tax=Methanonatronarchaeum thermophilum TaxID=1927129 RepID=A0A1Y3GI80_9EURY|nr:hypothetical protein [Methanonatronarchaeum thermophilum]OUJ19145.1 Nucleotide-binding protein UspA family [Methanonatronarchaeum thermophilum]
MMNKKILIPIEVLEKESVPEGVVDLMSGVEVILLGVHEIPEQTAASQASSQYKEKVDSILNKIKQSFDEAGAKTKTRQAFTHNKAETIERIEREENVDATILLNPIPPQKNILLVYRYIENLEKAGALINQFGLGGSEIGLMLVEPDETTLDQGVSKLMKQGVKLENIKERIETDREDIVNEIENRSADYGLLMIGRVDRDLKDLILGDISKKIKEATYGPVILIEGMKSVDKPKKEE